jgi:hypothetical protein
MSDLDFGINSNNTIEKTSPVEVNNLLIHNPFFNKKLESDQDEHHHEQKHDIVYYCKNYKRLLILCLLGKEPVSDTFYNKLVFLNEYQKMKSNLILIEANLKILKNVIHFNNIIQVNSSYLEDFNHSEIDLDDTEIVIPILNINFNDLKLYVNHYDGLFNLDDIFKVKLLEQYFNSQEKNTVLSNNFSNIIFNTQESQYWTFYYNCLLNMTLPLLKRSFNFNLVRHSRDSTVDVIINKLKKIDLENTNYLQFMNRKQVYVDASSAIKKKGYRVYRVLNDYGNYTYQDINQIFDCLPNEKQRYDLFNSLLVSKKHCHLALNNSILLDKLQPMIHKYIALYRYLFGYSWLTFYLEESIKRSHIETTDRFVFPINTANKLPFFPYMSKNLSLNPYLPLMIKKDVINAETNCLGFSYYLTDLDQYGITDLDGFREKLNVYTTGSSKKSIFTDLDWSNLAISGSTLAACLQKRHPLISLFEGICPDNDSTLFRFFNEYYAKADIDIMCNAKTIFDFMDVVFRTYATVKNNIVKNNDYADEKHINLVPYRKAAIIVNEEFIRKFICSNTCSYEYVLTNLKEPEVIQLFYPYYLKAKEELNEDVINEEDTVECKLKREYYKDYFEFIAKEDLVVIFTTNNEGYEQATSNIKGKRKEKEFFKFLQEDVNFDPNDDTIVINEEDEDFDDEGAGDDWLDSMNKENNITVTDDSAKILFKVNENIKYKIESPFLNHSLEIFQIKYHDFFSTVSRFHLPCVRGYYNGDNVYLLPSCISAHMTFINMDYKYFAGSKDPIEIINKYRCRGFGTILNDTEKLHLIEYSNNVNSWKNLYELNIKNQNSVNNVFGHIGYNARLFRPRMYNPDDYHDSVYVELNYNQIDAKALMDSEGDYMLELSRLYNTPLSESTIDTMKFKTIRDTGYVMPFKPWVTQAVWDDYNSNY